MDATGMDPVSAGRALVAELFPDALYAFVGGGVLSGHRTPASDLDVVVVLQDLPVPYRESLRWREWPVDLMVHNELSLTGYADLDLARRMPTLPRVCAEGVVIADRAGRAAAVQAVMRERLSRGPGSARLERDRYVLSDLLDDLSGATDAGEQAFIRWQVVQESARLALASAGRWQGSGKWLLRELRAFDAALADELLAAHDDPVRLAAAATGVLERAGGRLWEGYRAEGNPFHQRLRQVPSDGLTAETAQSSGMHRLAGISGRTTGSSRLWMGQTHVAPSTHSANHHHGESETAIYVVSGTPTFVFADPVTAEETRLDAEPGDYIFVPPYVPHREENNDLWQEAVVVIARSTQDAIVVNLPDLRWTPR
jgi:uncharacterized RmlC-like cupin family protein